MSTFRWTYNVADNTMAKLPFEYEHMAVGEFGGTTPTTADFETARVVILPIPFDRTTSYVPGTRTGPHEILVASSHMELWDEETQTDVHSIGIHTLPEIEFPFATMEEVVAELRRVAAEILKRDKFPIFLGGEHSITPPLVEALSLAIPGSIGSANRRARRPAPRRTWARRIATRAPCGGRSNMPGRRRWGFAACRQKRRRTSLR